MAPYDAETRPQHLQEHRALAGATVERDAETSCRLLRRHFETSATIVRAHLPTTGRLAVEMDHAS